MVDVQKVITLALAKARAETEAVRVEHTALLSKLMAQRDELTTTILNLTAQIADTQADIAAIDAAAADTVKPIVP